MGDVVAVGGNGVAKAYVRPGGLLWLPYAFYAGTEMIGFTELAYEPESADTYWIFHFFIDVAFQGQGYGKQALLLFLDFIKQQHAHFRSIQLTVRPQNVRPHRLYAGAGFQPTGDNMEGEPIYRLVVR